MFKTEMQKILDSSEKKIVFMKESPLSYIVLAALAGIYLGFGIVLIFSITGPIAAAGGGAYLKLIMGSCFGIALSLVIFAGSELFTGNNMVFAISSLEKRVGFGPIIILFVMCFIGNYLGSAFLAWLVVKGGSLSEASNQLILKVSAMKMALDPTEAFIRGILCNWLVCLAVWISLRAKEEAARLIMIFWCLFAFIGSGFEHSIANQTLLSMAMFLPHGPEISIAGFAHNQLYVVLGNLVGGGAFVGAVYWFASPSLRMEAGASDSVSNTNWKGEEKE